MSPSQTSQSPVLAMNVDLDTNLETFFHVERRTSQGSNENAIKIACHKGEHDVILPPEI